jgi:hypothetical protein
MYVDDGSSHDIHVTADGQEYDAQANYDSHHDGVTDSVMVETDYGHIEYIDSHHSGHADVLREVDSQGKVIQEAHFDASTGQWVAAGPNAADTSHTATGPMVVDTANGDHAVGPPTVDTSGSGVPDTAVVRGEDGSIVMYTDTDGDGKADVEVEITKDGQVTVLEHTGPHQWTQVEHGHIDSTGAYVPDSSSAKDPTTDSVWAAIDGRGGGAGRNDAQSSSAATAVSIDAITGQWVAAGPVASTGDSSWV